MPKTSNEKHQKGNPASLNVIEVGERVYHRDELIEDIRELADTNPERRITRDFYRKNSDFPESAWTGLFGTFPEFLRQADLSYSRYQNRVNLRTAQHASVDELRALDGQRRQYARIHEKADSRTRWKTIVAGSDFHDIECDPFFRRVFRETVRVVQPDVVCFGGDIFDLPEFGKYSVDPREWDVVKRITVGREIMAESREAAPDAQIDLIEGNHEARLLKHMVEAAPALRAVLSDFHGMDVAKLFRLHEYEINYHAMCDLHAFTDHQLRKEAYTKNFKLYWNTILAHHFPHGRNMGKPGFNGHHHKHIVWPGYNLQHGSYEWHQMGAGHLRDAPYCDGAKWSNGFLIAHVDTHYDNVSFEYVDVGITMAVAAGNFYYRGDDEIFPALRQEMMNRSKSHGV